MERTAGLIEASTPRWQQPLTTAGSISVIRRMVLSYQQAGLFPIVVLTGEQEKEVWRQLADAGVIFLPSRPAEPMDALRQGLAFLEDKCARVVYAPANAPFFTAETIHCLLSQTAPAVVPTHNGHGGHPILLARTAFPSVMAYAGDEGLRGALRQMEVRRVEVRDEGVLGSARDRGTLERSASSHSATLVQPLVSLSIAREGVFYDRRVRLLLYLIDHTRNLRRACSLMALSVGKAWDLLNTLERELGYPVVLRRQGGRGGGQTSLTPQGETFLHAAETFEDRVTAEAGRAFREIFRDSGIL